MVDEMRCQGFFFSWVIFVFKKVIRNFIGGEVFFLVINGQWEEICFWFDLFDVNGGSENCGFVIGYYDCVVCLLGDLFGFDGEWVICLFNCFFLDIEYIVFCMDNVVDQWCRLSFLMIVL